jgi:hypothetical protein
MAITDVVKQLDPRRDHSAQEPLQRDTTVRNVVTYN